MAGSSDRPSKPVIVADRRGASAARMRRRPGVPEPLCLGAAGGRESATGCVP